MFLVFCWRLHLASPCGTAANESLSVLSILLFCVSDGAKHSTRFSIDWSNMTLTLVSGIELSMWRDGVTPNHSTDRINDSIELYMAFGGRFRVRNEFIFQRIASFERRINVCSIVHANRTWGSDLLEVHYFFHNISKTFCECWVQLCRKWKNENRKKWFRTIDWRSRPPSMWYLNLLSVLRARHFLERRFSIAVRVIN